MINRVYFIYFPDKTPMYALLPDNCVKEAVFSDLQEATAYFSALVPNETTDRALDDQRDEEDNFDEGVSGENVVFVNCLDYYRRVSVLKKDADAILLKMLELLRDSYDGLKIRILMPREKNTDQELLIELMSKELYDFWFLSTLDKTVFHEVLTTTRSFRDLEAYLSTLPAPVVSDVGEERAVGLMSWLAAVPSVESTVSRWVDSGTHKIRQIIGEHGPLSAAERSSPDDTRWANTYEIDIPHEPESQSYKPTDESYDHPGEPQIQISESYDLGFSPEHGGASRDAGGRIKRFLSIQARKSPKELDTGTRFHGGATILFYSQDDCVMPYALGIMTALKVASKGAKTLLVELPGSGSRLGEALGLRHSEKNLAEALRYHITGKACDWNGLCFNSKEYLDDDYAQDRRGKIKKIPAQLYFLPDNYAEAELLKQWSGFIASLIHWAIIEARFSYLVYVGFGRVQDAPWSRELICGNRIISYQPWPGGFNEAADALSIWQKKTIPAFDASWGSEYIKREMKLINQDPYLIIPGAVKEDFIKMTSCKTDFLAWTPDSERSINQVCANLV